MNRNRLANSIAITTGLICLLAAPSAVRANDSLYSAMQGQVPATPGGQAKADALSDDFAGLTYSDEQKAEIAKIHQATESKKATVAKAQNLNSDQKDAMLLGYTRMEYGEIYKVLTPEQRREVRKRIQTRREADQATQRREHPHS